MTISRGKLDDVIGYSYSTAIILLENITEKTLIHRRSLQDRNDKLLVSKDLENKNIQLKRLNEDMHSLVQEEIKKNRENQKLIKLQARHAQMGELIGMITHQWRQPLNIINMSCIFFYK